MRHRLRQGLFNGLLAAILTAPPVLMLARHRTDWLGLYVVSLVTLGILLALHRIVTTVLDLLSRRERFRPGHCPRCGYDLRASPERCPECGRRVSSPTP